MAGKIQSAINQIIGTATAGVVAGKKAYENKRQASENASKEAKANQEAEVKKAEEQKRQEQKLASDNLEADLIRLGAKPESARAFMDAKSLGLDTKGFGMLRKKGKFIGSYSSIAEKLSQDALTDSLSSKAINDAGFRQRVLSLSGTRKGRVEALVQASGGTK